MKRNEFKTRLEGYGYNERQVGDCLSGVELLETFTDGQVPSISLDRLGAAQLSAFLADLRERKLATRNRLIGIYHYADMLTNYDLQMRILELLDGYEILGNLHRIIGEVLGEDVQGEVFEGVELPPLGTVPEDWMRVNAVVFPRLQAATDADTVRRILRSGLRNLPDAQYQPAKERYEALGSVDAFLEARGQQHLAGLIEHRDNGTPYFNQMITDDVIDFVKATPEIGRGVREGNTVIEIKIPHQSVEYLATSDPREKQYRVCHCPVVKPSIQSDELDISPAFCDFCPSFNAKPWEVIFGRKLDYDVIESALRGDLWCRFAIHLPEDGTQ